MALKKVSKTKAKTKSKLGNKKTVIDNIEFDSKLEAKYYLYLQELQKDKKIDHFELQPEFTLIPPFEKNGKKYRATKYIADFKIYRSKNENDFYLVDTKGFVTKDFAIKEKLFNHIYRDIDLQLLTFYTPTGEWLTLKEAEKRRKSK